MSPARPPVTLQFDRGFYEPGQKVSVRAELNLRRSVQVTRVEAVVRCREVVKGWDLIGSSRGAIAIPALAKGKVFDQAALVYEERAAAPFESGPLAAGKHVFAFEAVLPKNLPPSFLRRAKGRSVRVGYRAELRLRIKGRRDWRESAPFKVRKPPGHAPGGPRQFSSAGEGSKAVLTVSLHSPDAVRGLRLSGVIGVASSRPARLRGLRIKLIEEVEGQTSAGKHTIRRTLSEQQLGGAVQGEEMAFSLEVPAEALPSYRGIVCDVRHRLSAEVDLAAARNPKASVDVTVH